MGNEPHLARLARLRGRGAGITVPTAFGLLACGLVLLATSNGGVGLLYDSGGYVAAARNLAAGRGFAGYDGRPMVIQPPLFPAAMAALGACGVDPVRAARWVNALAFGGAAFIAARWLLASLRSRALAASAAVAVVTGPVLEASVVCMSESLFVGCSLLALDRVAAHVRSGRWSALVAAGAFAGAACLTRYIGVTVVLAGAAVLLAAGGRPWKGRASAALVFCATAGVPLALWLGRNYAVASTLMGPRLPAAEGLAHVVGLAARGIALWAAPDRFAGGPVGLALVLCVVAAIGAAVVTARRRQDAAVRGAAVFTGVYLAYLVVTASRVAFDALDQRLLSPAAIPAVFVLAWAAERVTSRMPRPASRAALAAFALLLALRPVATTARAERRWLSQGVPSLAGERQARSSLVSFVRRSGFEYPVHSNMPPAVYLLADLPARPAPQKRHHGSDRADPESLPLFLRDLARAGGAYLVWFTDYDTPHLYPPRELADVAEVTVVAEFPDGAVYRLRPRTGRGESGSSPIRSGPRVARF